MSEIINKKTLEKLADLARIEIKTEKSVKAEDNLLKNLEEIIDYFEELKKVDTSKVEPLNGGVLFFNVAREDGSELKCETLNADLTDNFLEKENNYLKVPGVFE